MSLSGFREFFFLYICKGKNPPKLLSEMLPRLICVHSIRYSVIIAGVVACCVVCDLVSHGAWDKVSLWTTEILLSYICNNVIH